MLTGKYGARHIAQWIVSVASCEAPKGEENYELILMLKMKWMSLILLDLALAGLKSPDLDQDSFAC